MLVCRSASHRPDLPPTYQYRQNANTQRGSPHPSETHRRALLPVSGQHEVPQCMYVPNSPLIDYNPCSPLLMLSCSIGINEALRLYPPVPIGIPRLLANDQLIGTTPLPKGTRVSVHHYAAYRSTTNFTNPEQFIPERWLSGYEDKRDVFQPFSYGPRNCLGQNMAWHEMRLIFGMLVAGFDMELCEESQAWLPGRVFVLWEKKPLMVKVRAVEG